MKRRLVELLLVLSILIAGCASSVLKPAALPPTLQEQIQALLTDDWNVIEVLQFSEQLVVVAEFTGLQDDPEAHVHAVDGILAILRFSLQFFEETTPEDPEIVLVAIGFVEAVEYCESGWIFYGTFAFNEHGAEAFLEIAETQRKIWIESQPTFQYDLWQHCRIEPFTLCYTGLSEYDPPIQEYP